MRDLKIKYKIAFSLIAIIVCFSIVNTAIYSSREYKLGVENYKITSVSIIKNVEPHAANHIYINDVVRLQRMVNGIKESNRDIIYAFILNSENDVMVHTFNQKFPSDLLKINNKPIQNVELLDIGDKTVYDFSYPILAGKLGIIRIGVSRERLLNDLRKDLLNRIIILFIFITIGTIISLYISQLITNSLNQLVKSVGKISEGNFKHTINIKSKDEIGTLSMSFNAMCNNLQNLTDKLEEKITLLNHKNDEYAALNEEYVSQNEALFKAKEDAKKSDNLKTAFLANLSHEIRTPMNGILGFANLLKTKKMSEAKQQNYIDVIEQSGQRMLKLITDLVDISKIEANQVEIKNEQINLNQLMDRVYAFYKPQTMQKGVSLGYKKPLPDNESILMTDGVKLEQILFNLINNALKFTSTGTIHFGYELRVNKIQFWVKDTGKGIPTEMQKVIFERFRQVNNESQNVKEGSGLGLAICKAFIELMGGNIWVESELTKGSAFYFTLPYVKAIEEKK